MSVPEVISQVRSGLIQVHLERDNRRVGNGTAFLVGAGIVTNSHVVRPGQIDALVLRMADTDPANPESYIRLLPEAVTNSILAESPANERDHVLLDLHEPEFEGRHRFVFADRFHPSVGQQVIFLGFPFGMNQLTAHVGYISSVFERNGVRTFQIDGSVNGGNSGGPLLDIDGRVIGIVTRAVTGLIEEQFARLVEALQLNQQALEGAQGVMGIGGIDPIHAIRASQAAMEQIAKDLHRSANVGIGYAHSAEYVFAELPR